jgi:hypothetical protein
MSGLSIAFAVLASALFGVAVLFISGLFLIRAGLGRGGRRGRAATAVARSGAILTVSPRRAAENASASPPPRYGPVMN